MKFRFKHHTRKIHRYMGIFIGFQFLLWSLGGLYFSWMNIREIRGEHLQKEKAGLALPEASVSPAEVLSRLKAAEEIGELHRFQLIEILQKPFYEVVYSNAEGKRRVLIVDAVTGAPRAALEKAEAERIAKSALKQEASVKEIEYLTAENVSLHHEYREKPLPAYAVTFDEPDNFTVYVAAQTGRVEAIRTNEWRVFDFLWMLHTMGFQDRDDINNYLLRGFSVLGILTILSGYLLFFISSPAFRRKRK